EAVRAQHGIGARDEAADLVGEVAHVVGRGDHRAGGAGLDALGDVGLARLVLGVHAVPALGVVAVARSSVKLGQEISLVTPKSLSSSSAAAMASRRMVPLPISCTRSSPFLGLAPASLSRHMPLMTPSAAPSGSSGWL